MNAEHHNSWLTRLDYIFVLRPMLFFPGWSTMLAGYFIDYKRQWLPYQQLTYDWQKIVLLILGFGLIMGSCFILNQLRDIETDRKNKKLFLISDGILSVRTAKIEVAVLTALALAIGFYISHRVGFFFLLFFILTGYLYNYPPLQMKDKPWLSLLANGLMGWFAFAAGWSVHHRLEIALIFDSFPYFFFNTALYLFTTLPDREGDRVANKKTLAVQFGQKHLILAAFVLFLIGMIFSVLLTDVQAILFYLLSIPFFVLAVSRNLIADTLRATKYGILFFALSICLRLPYYLILMIAGYFVTKFYYKIRFDFNYPNFAGK